MQRDGEISVDGGKAGLVLVASGEIVRTAAQGLASALRHLDPAEHPCVTVDLRRATSVDPLVISELLASWERRDHRRGSIHLLVAPGPVEQCLDGLGLTAAFSLIRPASQGVTRSASEDATAHDASTSSPRETVPRLPERHGLSW